MGKEATRVRRRERKNIASGVAHVNASFNNTMITITDVQGNTIAWSSSGTMGFKGSRKSTPYAAQVAAEDAAKKAQEHGMRTLESHRSGRRPGNGVALCVGDGDGRVVERRIHMRNAGRDVLAFATAYAGGILAHFKPFLRSQRRRNASGYT